MHILKFILAVPIVLVYGIEMIGEYVIKVLEIITDSILAIFHL